MGAELNLNLSNAQKERLLQLNGLDEFRMQALLHTEVFQLRRKVWHDKNIKEKAFQEGCLALLYYSRFKYFKVKLITRWLGPYTVEKYFDNGAFQIRSIDEEGVPLLVNGHRIKIYKRPLSKEKFINSISREVYVMGNSIVSHTSQKIKNNKNKDLWVKTSLRHPRKACGLKTLMEAAHLLRKKEKQKRE